MWGVCGACVGNVCGGCMCVGVCVQVSVHGGCVCWWMCGECAMRATQYSRVLHSKDDT